MMLNESLVNQLYVDAEMDTSCLLKYAIWQYIHCIACFKVLAMTGKEKRCLKEETFWWSMKHGEDMPFDYACYEMAVMELDAYLGDMIRDILSSMFEVFIYTGDELEEDFIDETFEGLPEKLKLSVGSFSDDICDAVMILCLSKKIFSLEDKQQVLQNLFHECYGMDDAEDENNYYVVFSLGANSFYNRVVTLTTVNLVWLLSFLKTKEVSC